MSEKASARRPLRREAAKPDAAQFPAQTAGRALPMTLLRAYAALMRPLQPLLDRHALTLPQWRVLCALAEHGDMPAGALANGSIVPAIEIAPALEALAARDLVARPDTPEPEKADDAAAPLAITAAGRRLFLALAPHAEAHERALAERAGAADLAALRAALETLISRLTPTAPASPE